MEKAALHLAPMHADTVFPGPVVFWARLLCATQRAGSGIRGRCAFCPRAVPYRAALPGGSSVAVPLPSPIRRPRTGPEYKSGWPGPLYLNADNTALSCWSSGESSLAACCSRRLDELAQQGRASPVWAKPPSACQRRRANRVRIGPGNPGDVE
ncbi:hypothetical protein SKAU_G00255870 [Synaphobranchus kaupii]|uniref:Uncharacterized protein n=1 Tax=Synaphobranchus kaupii TaxID=118154 RepID=A0A9Q1F3Q3_SYNKA|nr:hypothetical protein SKAU_G00255870 [Synaphobranchus kaupii]